VEWLKCEALSSNPSAIKKKKKNKNKEKAGLAHSEDAFMLGELAK
jgi:hypothetical protein